MFSGDNLYFRRFQKNDLDTFIKWQSDIENRLLDSPSIAQLGSEHGYDKYWEEKVIPDDYAFAVVLKEHDEFMGCAGFKKPDFKNRNAEFYILIGERKHRRQGFGSEAMNILLDYGFLELNFHRVWGGTNSFNQAALNFYQAFGFIEEGRLRQQLWRQGQWHDVIHIGLLAAEYQEIRKNIES